MNLHQIVSGAIGAVNPFIAGTLQASAGYTTSADGTQVPAYAAPVTTQIQVQALTGDDLRQLDGINIEGEKRAVYLNGDWRAVIRPGSRGGDLLSIGTGPGIESGLANTNWLVAHVLEQWPNWTKFVAVRQL